MKTTSSSNPSAHVADATETVSRAPSAPKRTARPWRPIKSYKGSEGERVTLWLSWGASPLTMGMGDAFAVRDCWRQGGKWVHVYRGGPAELATDYITHYARADAELTSGPRGADLDWWRP